MTTCTSTHDPNNTWDSLADGVLAGRALTRAEARSVLDSPDDELLALLAAAYRVRKRHFGNRVQLYFLKNAKSGLCPEDCGYCSQSSVSDADVPRYRFASEEQLLEDAHKARSAQAGTYCIVASGRGPSDREVERLAAAVRRIKVETGLHICACLGLLNPGQAAVLAEAGVNRINHNLNTSRRFYPEICSTHTFDDRLETLRVADQAGMELCSGLIVGMGETPADVVDVVLDLRRFRVASIPVNFLHAIDGTPLENTHELDPRYCLKTLCLLRLAHPAVEIRIAGGREVNLRSMQAMGLYAANSIFVSDYLTTAGQAPEDDYQMIRDLGFEIAAAGCEYQATETDAAVSTAD